MTQTDLDDKLQKIFNEEVIEPIIHGEGVNPKDYFGIDSEDIIAQIKQAFADQGYVQTLKLNNRTIVVNGKDNLGWIVYYPDEAMTGDEWYERFNREVELLEKYLPKMYADFKKWGLNKTAVTHTIGIELDAAARRAAGLE